VPAARDAEVEVHLRVDRSFRVLETVAGASEPHRLGRPLGGGRSEGPRGSRFAGIGSRIGFGRGGESDHAGNGKRATGHSDVAPAADEGNSSKGVKPASRGDRTEVRHRLRTGPAPLRSKRDEPQTGCGAQQTREPACGANRRGGEKPRGRNTLDAWQRRAEGSLLPGVDARGHVGGGAMRISREEDLPRGGTTARGGASKRKPRS